MKIDIDKLTFKNVRFLISLQKPYEIRAGNKGLNIRKDCHQGCTLYPNCYGCWMYLCWDDKNRLKLNIIQKNNNLSHNILWDIKKGEPKPDVWHWIETEQDIDLFLRHFFTGFY